MSDEAQATTAAETPTTTATDTAAAPSTEATNTGATENKTGESEAVKTGEAETKTREETKTGEAEAKTGEEGKGDEGEQANKGAPEKYEFKAPESGELSPDVMTAFEGVARELNLTNEGAQRVLDQVAPALVQAQQTAFNEQLEAWADQTRADKELGGDKLDENLAIAKKGLEAYGTPELAKLMQDSGLGNHPEVIRHFRELGMTVQEDSFVGGSAAGRAQSAADRLYGTNNKTSS